MWRLLKAAFLSFIEDEALSRGAAIAFYTVTSLAPILLIVIAIAGLAFGQEAAQAAITSQLTGLMGQQTADVLESVIASASSQTSGILATLIGIVTLLVTASGVFGEMQTALNKIWDAEPRPTTISRLIKARAASLGLVATLGFLLLVSLVISAVLTAFGNYLNAILPFGGIILSFLNFVVSVGLISVLFAAIYKVLPDRPIAWRDVILGAVVTALLFTIGKSLIGWYLGSSAMASSYGAAGGLIILLLWVYYSVQIFLLGAEFTKAYASSRTKPFAGQGNFLTTPGADPGTKRRQASSSRQQQTANTTGERAMVNIDENQSALRELEGNAARNRADLMDTIDVLQERISPTAIKHNIQDYVQSRTDSVIRGLEQRARDNPLQAVAIAAGLAYPLWSMVTCIPVPLLLIGAGLALSRRSGGIEASNDPGFVNTARRRLGQTTDSVVQKYSDVSASVQDQVEQGMDSARNAVKWASELQSQTAQRANDLTARVGDRVGEAAKAVRGVSSEVVARTTDAMSTDHVRNAASQTRSWVDDTVGRNPLIVGGIGIAVGALIAAALPITRQEDEFLGPAADDVKKRAHSAVREGVESAKGVAEELYQDTARHAKEEGLSKEHAKEIAGQVTEKIRSVATTATDQSPAHDADRTPSQTTPNAAG